MADVYGVSRGLAVSGTRVSPSAAGGEVRVVYDNYVANALAQGSTIEMGGVEIPAGARCVYARIRHGALGASTTLTLSVGGTTLITAASSATAATKELDVAEGLTEIAASGLPTITLAGANSAGANQNIELLMLYTCY